MVLPNNGSNIDQELERVLHFPNETFFTDQEEEDVASGGDVSLLDMPIGVRVFWDLLFGSSILISILGNASVLWTIIGK